MTRGEDGRQNIGASEYRQRKTVQNAKEEQPERAQMEQHGSEASAALFRRGLNQIDMHQHWVSESHICPPRFLLSATQFRKPVAVQSVHAIPVLGAAG
jgi:hypothetical protein